MEKKLSIQDIDSNFKPKSSLNETDIVWFDSNDDIFAKYGAIKSNEEYLRMPREVAKTVNAGTLQLCDNTSGVRIRFCTDKSEAKRS